jgi:uncharacterized protein YecE (DUF72 family)
VQGWYAKTPPGFLFAAKVPQVITHEKVLVDCDEDLKHFLTTTDALGEKLGPLLFQFGYFNASKFKSGAEFILRLKPFLQNLPKAYRFAVEIRNKNWLDLRFVDLLREHGVALALIDQGWMPRPWEMKNNLDLITADFTYVRWLGDRTGIEEKTKTWDKVIVDRRGDLAEWVELLKKVRHRRIQILAFANNHYAVMGLRRSSYSRSSGQRNWDGFIGSFQVCEAVRVNIFGDVNSQLELQSWCTSELKAEEAASP